MRRTAQRSIGAGASLRYARDSLGYMRLVNLSDAVFAIAMTLLAFKVDAPGDVLVARDLAAVVPQVLAFLLSFAVVANFWWHHHRLLTRLDAVDPGLVVLNLALLGTVALVPFPTEMIGRNPGALPGAVSYLGLMLVITSLTLVIVAHAGHADLWADDVSPVERRQSTVGWAAMLGVTVVALLVALAAPVAGLVTLLLTGAGDHLARRCVA